MFQKNVTSLTETKIAQQQQIKAVQKQLAESKVKIEQLSKNLTKDKAEIDNLTQLRTKTEQELQSQKKTDQAKIEKIVKDAKVNLENKINEGKVALE